MNIAYLAIPVIVGLVIGASAFILRANLTGQIVSTNPNNPDNGTQLTENKTKCPSSCDDRNPCTVEWCNETSNYECSYVPINGTLDSCRGNPTTCSVNTCVDGKCVEMQIRNCCGNNICESSESCNSCANDCGNCPLAIVQNNMQQTTETPTQQNQTIAQNTNPPDISNTTQSESTNTTTQNQTTLNHIVISEVQTGPNEFIELYNPTNSDVNATGWYLSYYSSNRTWNNTYRNWAFPNNTILKTGKFFLINIFTASNSDWTVLTAEGNPYSVGQISDNGSISIFSFNPRTKTSDEAKNGRTDTVGWNSPVYVFESSPAITPENGKSLQRTSLTSDTDNNSQDFSLNDSPSPKNSTNQ